MTVTKSLASLTRDRVTPDEGNEHRESVYGTAIT
jgi:hypothetical protein